MLYRSLHFLRTSHAQQVVLRRNHHRHLIVHSFIFYSIWLTLWSPLMMTTFLNIDGINGSTGSVVIVANTMETCVDPCIAYFLDKRVAQAWKKFYRWILHQFGYHPNARVNPAGALVIIHQTNSLIHRHT